MEKNFNDSWDILKQLMENNLNDLVPPVSNVDPKIVELKDAYIKLKDYHGKLKDMAAEKKFKFKKIQTDIRYINLKVKLGKEELDLNIKDLDVKRYSVQKNLDLLFNLKSTTSDKEMTKIGEELSRSYQELKDTIQWSEENHEISMLDYENTKLEERKNSLQSEIEKLRSRLEYIRNEVSMQDKNNIYKWIVKMSSLAIEERKLYKKLKDSKDKMKCNNNMLQEKNLNSSVSLNNSVLVLPNSQSSMRSNHKVGRSHSKSSNVDDNKSISSSCTSSKNEKKSGIKPTICKVNESPIEYVSEMNKVLNYSFANSQCSIISSGTSDRSSDEQNDNFMDVMQTITESNTPSLESKPISTAFKNLTNYSVSNQTNYTEKNPNTVNIDSILNASNLFDSCQEEDYNFEKDLLNMGDISDKKDNSLKFSDIGSETIDTNLFNNDGDFIMDYDDKTDDTPKTVLFDDVIDIIKIPSRNKPIDNFTMSDDLEALLGSENQDQDDDDKDLHIFLNSSIPSETDDDRNHMDSDLGLDFNILDNDLLIDDDMESDDDPIFGEDFGKSNTNFGDFGSFFDS